MYHKSAVAGSGKSAPADSPPHEPPPPWFQFHDRKEPWRFTRRTPKPRPPTLWFALSRPSKQGRLPVPLRQRTRARKTFSIKRTALITGWSNAALAMLHARITEQQELPDIFKEALQCKIKPR